MNPFRPPTDSWEIAASLIGRWQREQPAREKLQEWKSMADSSALICDALHPHVVVRRKPRGSVATGLDRARDWFFWFAIATALLGCVGSAMAQSPSPSPSSTDSNEITNFIGGGPKLWTSREGMTSALQIMLMLTVLSLAPAILLMTTCFVRIVIVLGLLRQALGL